MKQTANTMENITKQIPLAMNSVTITLLNDAEGIQAKAFEKSCEFWQLEYTKVSATGSPILEYSVKYSHPSILFQLGKSTQLRATVYLGLPIENIEPI
jgi:hypothetical protein